jgi:hypothetical protein
MLSTDAPTSKCKRLLWRRPRRAMRNDPRTLLNTPYPLIVPAFRKSSGEMIDETLQPPNETLSTSAGPGPLT